MATNPTEREGCWLCAGSGEIETRIAGQNYKDVTVGCPVCVQNDEQWLREKAERERDELKSLLGDQTAAHAKTIERARAAEAHVEHLFETWSGIVDKGSCYSPVELEEAMCAVFADGPPVSLARHVDQVVADALDNLLPVAKNCQSPYMVETIETNIAHLRQRAKGGAE